MSSTTLAVTHRFFARGPSDRVARLERLGASGRMAHYRAGKLDLAELSIWACRYPEEVPTVNGELERIGLTLADLD